MKSHIAFLSLAALLTLPARAEPATGLDGATGNIFKVDLAARNFELLKETEYDPKTDLGKSRFTVHWSDRTTITRIEEKTDFAGVKGPVIADFHGIDDANSKALKEGKPFVARVAILHAGADAAGGVSDEHRKIVSWFTPDAGDKPRSGTIEVDGKPVKVSLRKRFARIYHHQSLRPADIAEGFWKTTIHGRPTTRPATASAPTRCRSRTTRRTSRRRSRS